jgi:hypothetical protein
MFTFLGGKLVAKAKESFVPGRAVRGAVVPGTLLLLDRAGSRLSFFIFPGAVTDETIESLPRLKIRAFRID